MLPKSNSPLPRRLRREKQTLEVMIRMYCAANHRVDGGDVAAGPAAAAGPDAVAGLDVAAGPDVAATAGAGTGALCEQCAGLLAYSVQRIDRCRFGNDKPTCARCSVHCFRSDMRERVREVMRYAGPRMASRHPYLAVRHLLDRRRTPEEGRP